MPLGSRKRRAMNRPTTSRFHGLRERPKGACATVSKRGRSCVRRGLLTTTSCGSGQETRTIRSRRSPRSPDRSHQRRLGQETEPNSVFHGLRECRRLLPDCYGKQDISGRTALTCDLSASWRPRHTEAPRTGHSGWVRPLRERASLTPLSWQRVRALEPACLGLRAKPALLSWA